MTSKVFESAAAALSDVIADHQIIMCGGFGLCGMPESLIDSLQKTGVNSLTVVSNNAGVDGIGLANLIASQQINKMISSYIGNNKTFEKAYLDGVVELEFSPQGTMAERIRAGGAGIPAFYTKTGVGTVIADGKDHREFDGEIYILEEALIADISLIRAEVSDTEGNLMFEKTARNFNPMMATAGKVTIVEVEEIVSAGQLDPNLIHTSGIYVQRIIKSTCPKRIEFTTTRKKGIA
tara:strand:- start:45 stop:752 length:708 start_codon:yes stop_codon:yes gene_type:complete